MASRGGYDTRYSVDSEYDSAMDPYYAQQARAPYEQDTFDPYNQGYRDEPSQPIEERPGVPPKAGWKGYGGEEKTTKNLRSWRYENQGNMWTRGGAFRSLFRFCCCTTFTAVFLIISVILALVLWIQPPNVNISSVGAAQNGSTVQTTSTGLDVNLAINITVENPNYLGVDLSTLHVEIFYPINNTLVGNGTEHNIKFPAHSTTVFEFPFTFIINTADDPDSEILTDIATKCGFLGGKSTDITINYKLTIGVHLLFFTVSPVISNSFSFACPISLQDIEPLLQNGGIGGLLGSL